LTEFIIERSICEQSTGKVLPLLPLRYQHSASLLGFRWIRKMEESNPYDISAVPCGSSAVAVHSAASSKLNNGSWRSRTPTVVHCTPVFETGCRPLGSSFQNFGCMAIIKKTLLLIHTPFNSKMARPLKACHANHSRPTNKMVPRILSVSR